MKLPYRTIETLIIVALVVALIMTINKCNRVVTANNSLFEALQDTLVITQNKLGEYVSTTQVLKSENQKQFLKIKSNDSLILKLQQEIKSFKKKNSELEGLVLFYSEMNTQETVPTVVDTTFLFPAYLFNFKNQWLHLSGVASQDSTTFDLKVYSSYTLATYHTKDKTYLQITNHNPYSVTTEAKSWTLNNPRPKRFGLGLSAGYGITPVGLQPIVSIGINYNLINF